MKSGRQLNHTIDRAQNVASPLFRTIDASLSRSFVGAVVILAFFGGRQNGYAEGEELRMIAPSMDEALSLPIPQLDVGSLQPVPPNHDLAPSPRRTAPPVAAPEPGERRLGAPPSYTEAGGGQGDSGQFGRPLGEGSSATYFYAEQSYERVSPGDWVDDGLSQLGRVDEGLHRFFGGLSAWGSSSFGNGLTLSASASLGDAFGLPSIWLGGGSGRADPRFFSARLGPLLIDDVVLGAGALYTEHSGHLPEADAEPDGWGSIVWLSARFTLSLTEHLQLAIRPMVYWLPDEGKVGYGLPAPVLGLPGLEPATYASLSYERQFSNWNLTLFDTFGAQFRRFGLFDDYLQFTVPSDLTPIDRVGRYSLGGYGSRTDFDSYGDLSFNEDPFDEDRLFFYNWAGARLLGQHGNGVQTLTYFDRRDYWEHDFDGHGNRMEGGAWVMQAHPFVSPYAGYTFSTADEFDSVDHIVTAGFRWQRGPRLSGYAQAGYLWTQGRSQDTNTWLGEGGIFAQLGPHTSAGIQGGRRVADPDFGTRYLEDYIQGQVVQMLGPETSLAAVAGYSKRERLDVVNGGDLEVRYAGLLMSHRISGTATAINLMAGVEDIEREREGRDYTQWTYRASIFQPLWDTVSLNLYYQYIESEGLGEVDDFTEHLLYLGVAKRL